MNRRSFAAAAAALSLAACATPPHEPPVAPSAALGPFQGAVDLGASAAQPPDLWWRLFDDPALNRHITRALAANADLRVAYANLEAARAQAGVADAARWPAAVVESGAGPTRADRQPSTTSVPKTSYELGATLAFEIDLFGRLKAAALAAHADADAVEAARDAVRLAVVADTASAYVDLCGAQLRQDLAASLLEIQQRNHDIVSDQLRAGEVSPLELSQAAQLRDQTAGALVPIAAELRRAQLRLATLEGEVPANADAACHALPRAQAALPVGDGAGLIARRPDLREAERRFAAAGARETVARADLYPRIRLGGSGGLIGGGGDAVLTPLITWAFPVQAAPRAGLKGATAQAKAARAAWDKALLRALEEVEGTLSDLAAEQRRHGALVSAEMESQKAATRAQARRRWGADSPLLVLDAERTRNTSANERLASEIRRAKLEIGLFRALGGGWREAQETPPTEGR